MVLDQEYETGAVGQRKLRGDNSSDDQEWVTFEQRPEWHKRSNKEEI